MRKVVDPLLGAGALGDILVGRDPPAVRQRFVDDLDRTSVRDRDGHGLPQPDVAQDAGAIGVDVAYERSSGLAMRDDLAESATRSHDVRRQAVHLDIARIAY